MDGSYVGLGAPLGGWPWLPPWLVPLHTCWFGCLWKGYHSFHYRVIPAIRYLGPLYPWVGWSHVAYSALPLLPILGAVPPPLPCPSFCRRCNATAVYRRSAAFLFPFFARRAAATRYHACMPPLPAVACRPAVAGQCRLPVRCCHWILPATGALPYLPFS